VVESADAEHNLPSRRAGDADAKPIDSQPTGDAQIDQPTKLSAPSESSHAERPATAVQTAGLVKPELASPPSIIVESKVASNAPTAVREAKPKPISVFVSLKEQKLYVRQGWQPLFDVPVTIHRPQEPIGTHVFTAMGTKSDGDLRWTAISIPSGYKHAAAPKPLDHKHKARNEAKIKPIEDDPPMPSAGAALDRIEIAPDVVDRIAALMMPGSSLIVSDNKLSDETDQSSDFIVLTR
jgi:hypothetical protein